MRIINLMENTPGTVGCLYEHGLSFYIETRKHRVLLDTGASAGFLENAKQLGIDLSLVDTVILSHGHYDHGGGLIAFAEQNHDAKIYMQASALRPYYHKNVMMEKYIGLDKRIAALPGVMLVNGDLQVDEELFLFSGVTGRKLWSGGNRELMRQKADGMFVPDDFAHEQCLVVSCEGKRILLSGCAHNGVLNILERYRKMFDNAPDVMISGFHMMKKQGYASEDWEGIVETARQLQKLPTSFYTGHCTGIEPYEKMKEILGEQLNYVHSGEEVCLLGAGER